MELRFTWRFAFALFLLTLLTCELHEQAHIQFGAFVCGCWGERDFSVWRTCAKCAAPSQAFVSSLMGPLFTYAVVWLGAGLMARARSPAQRTVGLALVFAPLPFARIFTVLTGSGDEVVFFRALLGSDSRPTAWGLAALLVVLACVPPIVMAWRRLVPRRRILWIGGLCVLPMLAQGAWVRLVMNGLLARGVGDASSIAGSPVLVMAHTAAVAVLLAFTARWLEEAGGSPGRAMKPWRRR